MTDDSQTYQRAATASIIGLLAQVVLTVTVALLGLYAQSSALHAAALHMLGGIPIWIILAVLFHQERQERIEALEADQFAEADASTAALFDEAGDQLRVARKRLAFLVKFWLNAVSLGLAVYLLAVGSYYLITILQSVEFTSAWNAIMEGKSRAMGTALPDVGIREGANSAAIAVIALGVGFIAFLAARYIAGMTQVKAWQPLRGGAGYLMGSGLVALLILIGAGLHLGAVNIPSFIFLAIIIPAIMILLGLEIILGFILGMYRPRKPGEAPRPAFESRILGWLTRPESIGKIIGETINYQFGFEISASWFYRLMAKAITPLIVLGALVLLGLSSQVIVGPYQNAVITRFGELERVVGPGLHWKLPWPVNRATKYDVYQVHTLDIASSDLTDVQPGTAMLWTNVHGGKETFFVTAEANDRHITDPDQAQTVAAGLIGTRVTLQYRINNLVHYVSSSEKPDELFRRRAERAISRYFATHNIDQLLSSARYEAGQTLRDQLQPQADDLGLNILNVSMTAMHPPQEKDVAKAFLEEIGADLEKQTKIEVAEKTAITTLTQVAGSRDKALEIDAAITQSQQLLSQLNALPSADSQEAVALSQTLAKQDAKIERLMDDAGGEAVSLIYLARAERWKYALSERAREMRTRSKYLGYQQAPNYYRMREYFNTLAEGLADRRKIIITTPNAGTATIRLNLEDNVSSLDAVFGE